ncbi:MAG: pilus assembly protein TadG-related protein [Hyphomicrobiales bacterium]|nr:pilus assembly protein TadG-related protein [Hyphomicrobiales bacterium]
MARCRAGQISTIVAIASVPIAMGLGIAVDFARASAARGQLQAAMDAAVIAGAKNGTSSWTTISANTFDAAVSKSVTVASRSFAADADGNYQGTATGTLATSFAGLFSIDALTLQVTATAVKPVSGNKVCILLNSTTASPGLLLNSGANLNAPNCEVHVKSTGNPAATFNSGTVFTTQKTCVAGSNVIDNGGTHASLTKSCTTVSDPFAGTLPTPASSSCTYSGLNYNGGSVTLSPGVYCYGINFNGTTNLTLNPGVYVIKSGNWNFNGGTMTGTGVTFYFADTSYIQFNGTTSMNLAAPTTGAYANLLWYEAQNLSQSWFTMNATNGATMTGLIWLPSRNLTLNSGASVTSNKLTMVLNTLIMNTVNWSLSSSDKSITTTSGSNAASGIYLKY